MSSRILTLLTVVAATLGLSALPSASLAATPRQADAPSGTSDTSADATGATDGTDLSDLGNDPSDLSGDQSSCDTSAADDSGGDTTDTSGDTAAVDPSADDSTDPATSDRSVGDCSDAQGDDGGDVSIDGADHARVAKFAKTGTLAQTIVMPGAGTIDETLTAAPAGSASAASTARRARVLGTKHLSVTKAGTLTVRVKLNKAGRKLLRTARGTLHLTLATHVVVTGGRTVDHAAPVAVAPAKHKRH